MSTWTEYYITIEATISYLDLSLLVNGAAKNDMRV